MGKGGGGNSQDRGKKVHELELSGTAESRLGSSQKADCAWENAWPNPSESLN